MEQEPFQSDSFVDALETGDEILFEPVSQDAFDEAWAKVEAGQMAALSEVLA